MLKSSAMKSMVMAILLIMISVVSAVALDKVEKVGKLFVNPLKTAQKYFVFTEGCWENIIVQRDFSKTECFKYTISKLLGYGIIAGSSILKLPQIFKILKHQSVEGISRLTFYMEIFMYLHTSAYSIHKGINFSVYGENVIIMMQNFVIVLLFWAFDKSIKGTEKLLCFLGLGAYIFLLV